MVQISQNPEIPLNNDNCNYAALYFLCLSAKWKRRHWVLFRSRFTQPLYLDALEHLYFGSGNPLYTFVSYFRELFCRRLYLSAK